jgi:signal transduction histidine kinase/CheY-like chemotaxis protein
MQPFRFSIRTLLLVVIGILNVLIAAPLGYMAYKSLINYNKSERVQEVASTIGHLYAAKKHISLERASSYSILSVPSASYEALKENLTTSRQTGDNAFEKAFERLAQDPSPTYAQSLKKVKESRGSLEMLRRKLDAAMMQSAPRKNAELSNQLFEATTQVVADVNQLIEDCTRPTAPYNPVLTRQLRLMRMVWEISEYAGQEYAILGHLIAESKYPDSKEYESLTFLRHRIDYGMDLAHIAAANSDDKDILPYMEEAETHYLVTFSQVEELFQEPAHRRPGVTYPIRVEMWLEMASQAVDSLHGMAGAIVDFHNRRASGFKNDARESIIFTVLLFLSALALSFYTWWLITNRVIKPVNSMIDALHRETRRVLPDLPPTQAQDEIAKLAEVLDVFQENSRQLVRERDKAEAASVAKSEFLANMSHEIRTPMNVVVGISNILSRTSPLTEKQLGFIKTLQVSAESLLTLINDLLDFSKIETHNFELEKISFNLTELIEEVVMLVSVHARERGLYFNIELDEIRGHEFIGDPMRIRQILTNICSNAVKFTEKGGITLKARAAPHDRAGFEDVLIVVSDTGIGIPPEKQASIFENFTQADSTITRKYGGTGLGLAITKNLVELMGGQITLKSGLGDGTSFMIYLPLPSKIRQAPPESQDVISPPPETVQPANDSAPVQKVSAPCPPRILLVEDYEPNVVVASTFLEQFGFPYEVATTGPTALQKYMESEYDVVLMNVQMPGMDGYQTTQAIRKFEKQNDKKRAHIIGFTAYASFRDKEKCLESGMDDHLAKPFEPQKLRQKILKTTAGGNVA